jgi:Type II CAAX prenyl endopeptidase Rce1-like
MQRPSPLAGPNAAWLLALGAASLGVAALSHSHLGLRLQPQGWLAWVAFLCLGPWVEEWAFRATLLPELTRVLQRWTPRLAPWSANALVSAVFVMLHQGMAGTQAWLWFIPSWVLGMVWFRFRRLSVCVLVHAWFNACLALVSLAGPSDASAQSTAMPCPSAHPPALSVSARHEGRHLQALVEEDASGRWVLITRSQAKHSAQTQCIRQERLLGTAAADPLPSLAFEGGVLTLQWFRPATATLAHSETHRMVLDGTQPQWPLVRYAHEVTGLTERRGVQADLAAHQAQWHRWQAPDTTTHTVTGALRDLPPPTLASLPHHTAFALRPLVPRMH